MKKNILTLLIVFSSLIPSLAIGSEGKNVVNSIGCNEESVSVAI
jgi:hypothetical protein